MGAFEFPVSERLRATALELHETSEGTSCVNRAFKVRNKNFLFVGEKDGQVKLMFKSSTPERIGALDDPRIGVGKHGWVTLRFAPEDAPDEDLLTRWVIESYRALAPKSLSKLLDRAENKEA